eukprot:PhM_4_TR18670/c4_g1_i2/m.71195
MIVGCLVCRAIAVLIAAVHWAVRHGDDPGTLRTVGVGLLEVGLQPRHLRGDVAARGVLLEPGLRAPEDKVRRAHVDAPVHVGGRLLVGHVEAVDVVREVEVDLVVARRGEVRHVCRDALDAVHEVVATSATAVVQIVGKVTGVDEGIGPSVDGLLHQRRQRGGTAVQTHITEDDDLRGPVVRALDRRNVVHFGHHAVRLHCVVVTRGGLQLVHLRRVDVLHALGVLGGVEVERRAVVLRGGRQVRRRAHAQDGGAGDARRPHHREHRRGVGAERRVDLLRGVGAGWVVRAVGVALAAAVGLVRRLVAVLADAEVPRLADGVAAVLVDLEAAGTVRPEAAQRGVVLSVAEELRHGVGADDQKGHQKGD